MGHGGPSLTSAAFAAGIADVRAALAARLYRWTGATDHASLPEVHRVLISTPKSAQYGTLNALLQARASTSNLQIATMNTHACMRKDLEFCELRCPISFEIAPQRHLAIKELAA